MYQYYGKNIRPFTAICDCNFGRKIIYTNQSAITKQNIVSELNKVVSDGKVDVVFCNQVFKEVLKSQYELSYKVVNEINKLKNKIAELGELEAKILMKSAIEEK